MKNKKKRTSRHSILTFITAIFLIVLAYFTFSDIKPTDADISLPSDSDTLPTEAEPESPDSDPAFLNTTPSNEETPAPEPAPEPEPEPEPEVSDNEPDSDEPETIWDTKAGKSITAFASSHGLSKADYPDSLVELLDRNPETERFVLDYPLEHNVKHTVDMSEYHNKKGVPHFLQWDKRWGYIEYGSDVAGLTACGPVCLSMVAYYFTGDDNMSPDKMIQFAIDNNYYVPGSGSSWTLISEGAKKLGLEVTELPLVKKRVMDNLEAGNPVVCVVGPGDFTTIGHFIVMVGCEDGLIKVNDPNRVSNTEKLWAFEDIEDQIRNLWVIKK